MVKKYLVLFVCAAVFAAPHRVPAQRAGSLSQARTISVDAFTGGPTAVQLRLSLIRQLSRSGRFQIVDSPQKADAVVKGSSQIWVRGFIKIDPRAPEANRQTIYGGYLSLEVVGAGGQPLWSWMITPERLAWSNIVDDLSSHAAKKLLEASEAAHPAPAAPSNSGSLAQTSLAGAGATFPAPLYQKWFQDFADLHPGVEIRYAPIGSQLGIDDLAAGKIDFAGSDVAPESDNEHSSAQHIRRIATVLGAVVPIYNLKGVSRDLRFTPETLAGIYMGRIKRWNDEEIRRTNKGADLPDAEIAVIHRSDGSGTTWVWSNFLSQVSPAWASSVGCGTTLKWPVGIGAEHSEGVADAVQNTPNSIGYVELTFAIQHQLSFGAVRNKSGEFIHADLDSLADAARSAAKSGEPPSVISDSSARYAYPIASFTWLLIPASEPDAAKRAARIELLRWILTSGQKECSAFGYAPLPKETVEAQLHALDTLP
jgi:phosphate ABC transporter phosphate-binding protein